MQDISLHWNQKKCSVVHVKRGAQVLDESGMRMDETTASTALGEGKHYRFLGVLENVRQDERLALACVASVSNRVTLRESQSRSKKMVEGGGGGEKRKRLPANPTILENAP